MIDCVPCCIIFCGTCVGRLFCAFCGLLFVGWFLGGCPGGRYIPVGPNEVALGYAADMLSLLLASEVPGYAQSWCGGKAELGKCDVKVNFPGPDTTSFMAWDIVWEIGALTPEKEWSGEWWRGNELGFIINNPLFWSGIDISPQSIGLGITPKQHAAIRPAMEDLWGIGANGSETYNRAEQIVRRRIREFLARPEISLPTDTTALVHQILWEVGLKRNVTFEYAKDFIAVQGSVVALGTISQLIPPILTGVALGSLQEKVVGYVREYMPIIEDMYGDQLKLEDCSPSANCTVQAAAALWDALYAAGGLSVPGTINTGLGVLYTSNDNNPAPGATYSKSEALQFYWESIRVFPPVVGFPHWTTRPTCVGQDAEETARLQKPNGSSEACPLGGDSMAGFPAVNQFMGGVREVVNIALAMSDPRKWGADATQFKVRALEDYGNYSVGFAEMAVNRNVAGGRMDRVCPGKALALLIGGTFFEEFDPSSWNLAGDDIAWKATTPFVGPFVLASRR